jgi:hypothetical protein
VCKATKFGDIFIASTTRAYRLLSGCLCSTNTRYRRRFDMDNERLPEFNPPTSFPSVAVPSMMRRTQRPWGSGNTTPTGESDASPTLSPGAGAEVPGGWPVVPREDLRRRSRAGDGGDDGRVAERSHGRRGTGP